MKGLMIVVQRCLITSEQQVILQLLCQGPLSGFAHGIVLRRYYTIESFGKFPHRLQVLSNVLLIEIELES